MVDIISNFLSTAVGFLWGTPLIVLVLGSGALFTIGTGFFQFRHFGYFCKETFGALFDKSQNEQGSGHVSAFQAAATAVGGAVGVGNIGGVATAIAVGGPGALFWLWIAALLGMALKCAEVSLACYYRSYDENGEPYGGPTYYISKGLGQLLPKGMKLPFILAAIFGIGFSCNWLSGVQAYTITEGFCSAFNLPLIAFGVCYLPGRLGDRPWWRKTRCGICRQGRSLYDRSLRSGSIGHCFGKHYSGSCRDSADRKICIYRNICSRRLRRCNSLFGYSDRHRPFRVLQRSRSGILHHGALSGSHQSSCPSGPVGYV